MKPNAWVFLLALTVTRLGAAEEPEGGGGEVRTVDQLAPVSLTVNRVEKTAIVVLLSGSDVLVQERDLTLSGVENVPGDRIVVDDIRYVSLAELAPEVTFVLDERGPTLHLTVPPTMLATQRLDAQGNNKPPGLTYAASPSLFLNYAVQETAIATPTAFFETAASANRAHLSTSAAVLPNFSVLRAASTFSVDDSERLSRLAIGDTVATTDVIGGGAILGGISFTREFALDPYENPTPLPSLSGAAITPSMLDVYVNDVLVRSEPLQPGRFELSHVPVTNGGGTIRYVVRDVFGRTQDVQTPYYQSAGRLAEGYSDFGYNVGFRRVNPGTESFSYSATPALLARHRIGATQNVTLGARLEAAPGLISAGPSVSFQLPFGRLDLAGGESVDSAAHGRAGAFTYSFESPRFGIAATMRAESRRYATVSQAATDDRALLVASVAASIPLATHLAANVSYTQNTMRDQPRTQTGTFSLHAQIQRDVAIITTANATRLDGGRFDYDIFAGLIYAFGPRSLAQASASRSTTSTAALDLQKSLPVSDGYGYRLHAAAQDPSALSATGQYQGPYGRYEGTVERLGSQQSLLLSATGGIVAIGGRLFATRPVEESFALVRVPGVAGVLGTVNNLEAGRTNRYGDLLIPNLVPYYGNRVRVRDADVPLDYAIGRTEELVAPPVLGGAIARFDVRPVQRIAGTLEVNRAGRKVVPENGTITIAVAGVDQPFPIGEDGAFYLEDVTPGETLATIDFVGGLCHLPITVPHATQPLTEVGLLICTQTPEEVQSARAVPVGMVAGRLFLDQHGSGHYESGDPIFSGIRVQVDGAEGVTDAEGRFLLSAVATGDQGVEIGELAPTDLLFDPEQTVTIAEGKTTELSLAVRRLPLLDANGILKIGNEQLRPVKAMALSLDRWTLRHSVSARLGRKLEQLVQLAQGDRRIAILVQTGSTDVETDMARDGAATLAEYLHTALQVPEARIVSSIVQPNAVTARGTIAVVVVEAP